MTGRAWRPIRSIVVAALCVWGAGAIAAGSAFAIEGEWLLEGETLLQLEAKEEGETVKGKPISLTIPSLSATIECKEIGGSGRLLEGGTAEMKPTLGGCLVTTAAECKVTKQPITMEAKIEAIQASGYFYFKFQPLTGGKPLITFSFEGKGCPAEKGEVTGAFATEMWPEESLEPPLKFSTSITEKVNKGLKAEEKAELSLLFGKNAATLNGEFTPPVQTKRRHQFVPDTRMCMQWAILCPVGKVYAAKTTIKAVNEADIIFDLGTAPPTIVTCPVAKWEGDLEAMSAGPLPSTFQNETFPQACTGAGNCTTTTFGGPLEVQFKATGGGNGKAVVKGNPLFRISCNAILCRFGASELKFDVIGGDAIIPAKLTSPAMVLEKKAGSDAACGQFGEMKGPAGGGGVIKYEFTEPNPLFLTN